jgi:hypothetical protein
LNAPAIFGRDVEIDELRKLVSRRHSFLLHGSAGVAKTLLLGRLMNEIPELLYCGDSSRSQLVFRTLAAALLAIKNCHVLRACKPNAIHEKSAVSIRGIVIEALREGRYWIVLDHLQSSSQSFAAAIKDVCSRAETPLIAVARSAHIDAGFLLPMFSDRSSRYRLRNLETEAAKKFALRAAEEMQLEAVNRDEAIEKIVRYSKGSPGAIMAMLQMAVNPNPHSSPTATNSSLTLPKSTSSSRPCISISG